MADLEVSIPGAPVGAARPRFRRATGTTYKLKKHAGWESQAVDLGHAGACLLFLAWHAGVR